METRPATRDSRIPIPIQDEWGLFDPEQAGIAAVLRRIRESADEPPAPVHRARKPRAKAPR